MGLANLYLAVQGSEIFTEREEQAPPLPILGEPKAPLCKGSSHEVGEGLAFATLRLCKSPFLKRRRHGVGSK